MSKRRTRRRKWKAIRCCVFFFFKYSTHFL